MYDARHLGQSPLLTERKGADREMLKKYADLRVLL